MKTRIFNRRAIAALLCGLLIVLSGCSGAPVPAETGNPDTASTGEASGSASTAVPEAGPIRDNKSEVSPLLPADAEPGEADGMDDSPAFYGFGMLTSPREPAGASGAPSSEGVPATGTPEGSVDIPPDLPNPGSALTLTAAEWNDNSNWPFFTSLVTAGTIGFPTYGVDPRNRIAVTVKDAAGTPLANEAVILTAQDGSILWAARTDNTGAAWLFFPEGQVPGSVLCSDFTAPVQVSDSTDGQGVPVYRQAEALALTVTSSASPCTGTQIMFIVDTTGSMGDEIAYLQKDFSAITQRVEGDDVSYCACFYRDEGDEYVTKLGSFTSDVQAVRDQLAVEYADGGGDTPEAVDRILKETLADFDGWRDDCVKLAFLIFDAPPHDGTDAVLQQAVKAAAEKGIRLIPVVASNAERETELFGRALAICTGGTYVFLTDHSGVGESHLEPIVGDYDVRLLQDLIVEIIARYQG